MLQKPIKAPIRVLEIPLVSSGAIGREIGGCEEAHPFANDRKGQMQSHTEDKRIMLDTDPVFADGVFDGASLKK